MVISASSFKVRKKTGQQLSDLRCRAENHVLNGISRCPKAGSVINLLGSKVSRPATRQLRISLRVYGN